jgi:hypothetical protein
VLESGLATVTPEVLKRLLLQPTLLLELQELVLDRGGDYWDRVKPLSADLDNRVEQGRKRLESLITLPQSRKPRDRLRVAGTPAIAWYRQPWFVSLATAASILLAVFGYERSRNPTELGANAAQPAWGWNRSDSIRQDLPAGAYLNRLADAAEDWFQQRPQEPLALARRISEFRQGCSRLILSDHKPLTDADRKWLLVRCRLWAGRLDKHLAALEAGRDPLQVRAEVDETIRQLIGTIRTRTKEMASVFLVLPPLVADGIRERLESPLLQSLTDLVMRPERAAASHGRIKSGPRLCSGSRRLEPIPWLRCKMSVQRKGESCKFLRKSDLEAVRNAFLSPRMGATVHSLGREPQDQAIRPNSP